MRLGLSALHGALYFVLRAFHLELALESAETQLTKQQ
jgi:hypothetical protein